MKHAFFSAVMSLSVAFPVAVSAEAADPLRNIPDMYRPLHFQTMEQESQESDGLQFFQPEEPVAVESHDTETVTVTEEQPMTVEWPDWIGSVNWLN